MRRALAFTVHLARLPLYVVAFAGLGAWEWASEWKRERQWL